MVGASIQTSRQEKKINFTPSQYVFTSTERKKKTTMVAPLRYIGHRVFTVGFLSVAWVAVVANAPDRDIVIGIYQYSAS